MNKKFDSITLNDITDAFLNKLGTQYQAKIDEFNKTSATAPKMEQIQSWCSVISKMKAAIKKVKKTSSMTDDEKMKRIKFYLEKIDEREFSIRGALEYMEYRMNKDKEAYAKLSKMK